VRKIYNARVAAAQRNEGGFTLVELMVVVMIIAILLTIAIPTFLGAQNLAKNRSAQSSLRNSVTAAKTIYFDSGDYTTADPASMTLVEPGLQFLPASADASSDAQHLSVGSTSSTFYAAALASNGNCFFIKDDIAAGTEFATADSTDLCSADGATTTSAAWGQRW
jgi:type IV pilus assembly protein PilA